jgi:spore germination cell wall hydrolase CwlJ-like protein
MKIKRNIAGISAMIAAAAIAAAAGSLSGPDLTWDAQAAAAATAAFQSSSHAPSASVSLKSPPSAASAANIDTLVIQFEDTSGNYYDKKGFSSNRYEYTDDDLKALATVIYLEARNQPYDCMLAVGNVVMNRVLAPGFPGKTVIDVVSRPNQFCYNPEVTPNAQCAQAATDILKYEVWVVPQNTYFFRAIPSTSDWYSHKYYKHFGNTAFYRNSYPGRSDGDEVPPELFKRVYEWPQYGCEKAERVVKLQKMLDALEYNTAADGYFGKSTEKALMQFQKDSGLKADGIAKPETLKALIQKYGAKKYLALN